MARFVAVSESVVLLLGAVVCTSDNSLAGPPSTSFSQLQLVPSVEAPLFGMWNRLNRDAEHEVMHFWVEGSTWAGRYDKHPEPGLGFPNPPEGTSGDFRGADATNFVCEPTFPFYPCQNVVKVVEGTTQYKPPQGSPFEVLERHIVVREANGQEVMWQYWVSPGNFICPWYRSFDEALAAKPSPPNGDCIFAVKAR